MPLCSILVTCRECQDPSSFAATGSSPGAAIIPLNMADANAYEGSAAPIGPPDPGSVEAGPQAYPPPGHAMGPPAQLPPPDVAAQNGGHGTAPPPAGPAVEPGGPFKLYIAGVPKSFTAEDLQPYFDKVLHADTAFSSARMLCLHAAPRLQMRCHLLGYITGTHLQSCQSCTAAPAPTLFLQHIGLPTCGNVVHAGRGHHLDIADGHGLALRARSLGTSRRR